MIRTSVASSTSGFRTVALALACVLAVLTIFTAVMPLLPIARRLFQEQDGYVIAGLVGLLGATALPGSASIRWTRPEIRLDGRRVAQIAILMAALLWAGTYLLLDNYPLTRDEQAVVFDMAVFQSGHLAAVPPAAWRAFGQALSPTFLLPLPGHPLWVSSYMPVNAMLRTAFAMVADPALMNPILAAIGFVALYDIARRLFPQQHRAQAVALLLYATSAQVLVTAMTTYAMTGHLALNLIWLALYLRGTRTSHAMAMVTGFLAIGLHQIVFHPLFALPFIDQLRRRGEWRTAAAYAASYAAFLLFWISYPHIVAVSEGVTVASGVGAGSAGFVAYRLIPLLLHHSLDTLPLTAANLVRFICWQNLALVPLIVLGFGAVRRGDGIARPLLYGVVLTTVVVAFLLPYQGQGWGYRYLHGLIGNCVLLAAYGWRDFSDREEVQTFLGIGTLGTLAASLPFLMWQAHAFVHPYARMSGMIDKIDAVMVVVETDSTTFTVDEVRNRPDLANRPVRLSDKELGPSDIGTLCARGSLAFVDARQLQQLGTLADAGSTSAHFRALRAAASRDCRRNAWG